jgi:hypothetical protein
MSNEESLKLEIKELNKLKKEVVNKIQLKEIELENLLNSINQYKLL